MKATLALITLALVGCGKFEQLQTNSEVGALRPLTQTRAMAPEEVVRLTTICQAMARKNSNFSLQIPSNLYTFDVLETNCTGVKTFEGSQNARVKLENMSYVFESADPSRLFPFPKVETPIDGVLAGVCQNLQNLQMPMVKTSGEAIYITALDSQNCTSNLSDLCITVETGTPIETNFAIHTVETIKFKSNPADITSPAYGFFTQRSRRTNIGCATGRTKTVDATLKSM